MAVLITVLRSPCQQQPGSGRGAADDPFTPMSRIWVSAMDLSYRLLRQSDGATGMCSSAVTSVLATGIESLASAGADATGIAQDGRASRINAFPVPTEPAASSDGSGMGVARKGASCGAWEAMGSATDSTFHSSRGETCACAPWAAPMVIASAARRGENSGIALTSHKCWATASRVLYRIVPIQ